MLVTVDRKSSWQNVLTMNVSISYGGVTDPLVNRMALGLVVKLEKKGVCNLCQDISNVTS